MEAPCRGRKRKERKISFEGEEAVMIHLRRKNKEGISQKGFHKSR